MLPAGRCLRDGAFAPLLLAVIVCLAFTQGSATARRARACLLPAVSGRCFGYVPSYAYNPLERRCDMFVYGGCDGNDNRFDTRTDCELICRDI